ncbi:MAG TPA: uroporphyrinogen decarboxylase family protein [Terracidiphilus sp.]|nr:uroporphyrinogen decarboxylase family protein [Terracidiphilus sp.]
MATATEKVTGRERLAAALSHRQPDRVPIDFGSTAVTGIHASCVAGLRDYYGLEKRPVKIHEPFQMLGMVEEDLREAMGLDVAGIFPRGTMFGFPAEGWKSREFNGLEVLVPEKFNVTTDSNGDTLIYPEGDMTVPPSGRMPRGGYFFDCIIRQEAFDEDKLDPDDNLEEFGPISQETLDHLARATGEASATGLGVMASLSGTALGDIALVPAPSLKHPRGIRDVTEWYVSTSSRQEYIHKIFERQCDIAIGNLERVAAVMGASVQVVFLCGTDFGTQTSSFCSVKTFRKLYLPYYKLLCDWIHAHTPWKIFKHSCGAVAKFVPSFVEAGIEVLNPVQCSAAGMDPAELKANFGDQIVFWGGGVDTQRVLPFAAPAEVRDQVLRRCEILAPGGGFVFNTVHNVQACTPIENIVAMIDAVHEFNGRK